MAVARASTLGNVLLATTVLATSATVTVEPRTLTEEEWNQVRPLFKLVEEVAAGKPAPSDVGLAWHGYFLNAEAGVVFVPFSLSIEQGEFTSYPVAMYLRVVKRGAPAPAPGPRDALAQYPFEDAAIFERPRDGRMSRGFTAPPGEYDVYVGLTEKATAEGTRPRTVVLKQEVTVPDLQSDFTVSSIFVVDKIEIDPGNRRLNFEEQLDEPYVWWGTRLTPALRTTFGRGDKLSVTFLVYNVAASSDDKPDVEVQYDFQRRAGTAETFFIRTRPELFNAHTLKRAFSVAAGDLIIAGQEMPLQRFRDGDYRLVITVTDKASGKSLTRDVPFTVRGS